MKNRRMTSFRATMMLFAREDSLIPLTRIQVTAATIPIARKLKITGMPMIVG
ncbi:MAG: hypothetical protein HW389_1950 [Bacteroidetes bacterium]|nr:hypothetical protein [Bacteroidota bacterium]